MKIAIASGKGGTGKSTVALSLFKLLSEYKIRAALFDCDVEEPNCHLFLNSFEVVEKNAKVSVPKVDFFKCTGCRACSDFCEYNALAVIQNQSCSKCVKYCTEKTVACESNKVLLFKELCHSCGGCKIVCPQKAISEKFRSIGKIFEAKVSMGQLLLPFIYGELNIGEAKSPPLIKQVRNAVFDSFAEVQIIDSPPGTSCSAISAVEDCDYVILVAEPTPFGLNDLGLAVNMLKKLEVDFGIIINKSSKSDNIIDDYANCNKIKIIARIPEDRKIAEAYSRGNIFINDLPEYKRNFSYLIKIIKEGIMQ